MIRIKYQILFSIRLEHDYYGNDSFDDLQLVPSLETSELLRNQRMICRVTQNVLTVYVQTENDKPFIPLNKESLFRFNVSVSKGSFLNISSLKIVDSSNLYYYFTNLNNNKKNGKLYLSAVVPAYKNTEMYEVGAIVKKGSKVFEAIKASSNTDQHDTTDAGYWRDIVTHQLPSLPDYTDSKTYELGDLVKSASKVFECIKTNSPDDKHGPADTLFWQQITEVPYVTSADLVHASAIGTSRIKSYEAGAFYAKGSWVKAANKYFEALQPSAPGNAHGTNEGAFWKEVTQADIVQRSGFRVPAGAFAFIDIFHDFGETADYSLLNPAGKVLETQYRIRFKNRSTVWKYIAPRKTVTAITDTNGVYSFTKVGVNEFTSNVPIPLTRESVNSFKLSANINARNVEVTGLQSPTGSLIKPTDNTSNAQLLSEIYLNY